MSHHVVICSGGQLGAWALPYIENGDYLMGADRGALFLLENGYIPHIAIGDFDSVNDEQLKHIQEKSKALLSFDAIDKDYSDTELTFLKALTLDCHEITLLGALGTRMDHSIANIHLLSLALSKGIPAKIVDEHNCIRLIDHSLSISDHSYPYISLLPYTEQVSGITLQGLKYPLHDATITKGQSIGVSNELSEDVAHISIKKGQLLVIQARD